MKRNNQVFMMVFSALCLAIGIAIKNLTFFVPIGIPILKISFDGPAFRLAAVLFGPLYGAIIGGLADFVGFFLTNKSGSAWIPFLTITYALNICLVGYLWSYFKTKKATSVRLGYLLVVGFILVYGAVSLLLGIQKQPELWRMDAKESTIVAFEEKYEKTIQSWKGAKDFDERQVVVSLPKELVLKSQTWISESRLKKAAWVFESEETKTFESTLSKETKDAIETLKKLEESLSQAYFEEAVIEEMIEIYQLSSQAILSGESRMKQVRDSRRQIQGSLVMLCIGVVAMLVYLINRAIAKNQEMKGIADNFLQMFVSIFVPSIVFNWINTYILFTILFQHQKKNLLMFGVFRSAVNLVEVYYNTLIVLFLLVLLNPLLNKRGIYPFANKSLEKKPSE